MHTLSARYPPKEDDVVYVFDVRMPTQVNSYIQDAHLQILSPLCYRLGPSTMQRITTTGCQKRRN